MALSSSDLRKRSKPGRREIRIRPQVMATATKLLAISNSPDLVMDRGHYFAKDLTPQELEDLIDLLKTF